MLQTIESVNTVINNFIWGVPAMICIIGVGLYLSIRLRFIQFRKFGLAMKQTIGKIFEKKEAKEGAMTPFQAVCTALSATVGTGNIAGVAGAIAIGAGVGEAGFIAQRSGREQRQREKFVTDRIGEFFAGRNGAEAVAGHQNFHLGQYFQHDGHADGKAEGIVALIGTGNAHGTGHAFQRKGHDGFIRHSQQHIAIDGDDALADVFDAAAVRKENINGDLDAAAHTGKAGAVTQPLHAQVCDIHIHGAGTAGFKGDGGYGCGCRGHGFRFIAAAGRRIAAAGVYHLGIAGDGHIHTGQLLLLQAAVVDALHLNADFFVQAIQCIAVHVAGAAGRIGILVGIERHKRRLLMIDCA